MGEFRQMRLTVLLVTSLLFIAGLVLNITSYNALFQVSLELQPKLQQDIGSEGLTIFMNIISNLFNPTVCAGYIIIIYICTCRKLEILVFLVWFTFLSFVLSLLKQVIQQPRPYWVNTQIKMLEWTCYTEYGSPSGHAMLSIVLFEFLVRFLSKKSQCVARFNYLWYILVFLLELLVMFSRVYLGMHSINQVLFGLMIGCYSMVVYYMFAEHWLYTHCLRYLSEGTSHIRNFFVCCAAFLVMCLYQCLITYLASFDVQQGWIANINLTPKCAKSYNYATSFYLKCYEDMAIGVAAPAILVALSVSTNGSGLMKRLSYPRCCSGKFIGYILLTIICAAIPAAIFLNPGWKMIPNLTNNAVAGLLWAMNVLGFTIALIILVAVSPRVIDRCGLAQYSHFDSYTAFKQQVLAVIIKVVVARRNTRTQTQLESRRATAIEKAIKLNQ